MEALFIDENLQFGQVQRRYWRSHPWSGVREQTHNLARCLVLYWRLMGRVPDRLLRFRRGPAGLLVYLIKCAMHYHHYILASRMARREELIVNTF